MSTRRNGDTPWAPSPNEQLSDAAKRVSSVLDAGILDSSLEPDVVMRACSVRRMDAVDAVINRGNVV